MFNNSIIFKNVNRHQLKEEHFSFPSDEEWINTTLLHMGYPDISKSNATVLEMVKETIEKVKGCIQPSFLFKTIPLERFSNKGFQTSLFDIKSYNWSRIASYLQGDQYICCFAVTLGAECEEKIKVLGSDAIMISFVWDALLSTIAEFFADQAEMFIARICVEKGMSNTRRFSPGYCDLDLLQGQIAIFNFCHPEIIGIHLNKSGLMIPRKSITGFVMIAESVPYTEPCRFCKRNCNHRRSN